MQNSKKHNYLSEDQHGGRNGREALDIVLGKTITFDTMHLQRANFGCTDCDTKACYDRIIPLVLMLAYFKVGLPYNVCVFLTTILYSLKYTLTTAFREGPQQNWHKFLVALFGIGQGSTDVLSGWLFISDLALKCYARLDQGFVIKDPGKTASVPGHAD
eukprot:15332378-Ditylum_brightwellii.AAC.1